MGDLLLAVGVVGLLVSAAGPVEGAPVPQADVATGADLYAANCAACHGVDAGGAGAAPPLVDAVDRLGRDEVRNTIREGRDASPPMPAFEDRLTDAEIESVIVYLEAAPLEQVERAPGMPFMPHRERGWEHMMRDGMMGGWWGLWSVLWVVIGLALIALLVTLVVWLVRSMASGRSSEGSPSTPRAGSARETLDSRYARGEIGREEYLQARRDIGEPVD